MKAIISMCRNSLDALKNYLRPRRILIIVFMAGTIAAFCYGYGFIAFERGKHVYLLDFTKFYLSAQFFTEGKDIYEAIDLKKIGLRPESLESSRETLHPNLNMPVVTLLFLPFLATDASTGMVIWVALSMGFIFASAWLLGGELIRKGKLPTHLHWMISGFIAVLLFLYFPTFVGAVLGQLGQLLLLILCAAWIAARRGCDRLAGVLFGVALSLKPFTGIFLVVLPWLRRWRLIYWYVASFTALSLLGAIVFGPSIYLRYLTILQEVNWYGHSWNASFMAPLSILLGGNAAAHWLDLPWLARLISLVLSLALYLLLIRQVCQLGDPLARLDISISGSIPLMLLASPLGWLYYFPSLWITAFAVVLAVWDLRLRLFWWISAFALLVLSGIPEVFANSRDSGASLWTVLEGSPDTLALLAAFTLVLGAAWRLRKTSRIAARRSKLPRLSRPGPVSTVAPCGQEEN